MSRAGLSSTIGSGDHIWRGRTCAVKSQLGIAAVIDDGVPIGVHEREHVLITSTAHFRVSLLWRLFPMLSRPDSGLPLRIREQVACPFGKQWRVQGAHAKGSYGCGGRVLRGSAASPACLQALQTCAASRRTESRSVPSHRTPAERRSNAFISAHHIAARHSTRGGHASRPATVVCSQWQPRVCCSRLDRGDQAGSAAGAAQGWGSVGAWAGRAAGAEALTSAQAREAAMGCSWEV